MHISMHNRSCTPPRFSSRASPDVALLRWSREGSGVMAVPIERRLGLDDDNISRSSCEPWGLSSTGHRLSDVGRESTLKVLYHHPPGSISPRLLDDSQSYICHVPSMNGTCAGASKRTSVHRICAQSPDALLGHGTAVPRIRTGAGLAGLPCSAVAESDTGCPHAHYHTQEGCFPCLTVENCCGLNYTAAQSASNRCAAECAPHCRTADITLTQERDGSSSHFGPPTITHTKVCNDDATTCDEEQDSTVQPLLSLMTEKGHTRTESLAASAAQHKAELDRQNEDTFDNRRGSSGGRSHNDGCAAYAFTPFLWPPLARHATHRGPPTNTRAQPDGSYAMDGAVRVACAATPPAYEHVLFACDTHGDSSINSNNNNSNSSRSICALAPSPHRASTRACFETPVARRHSGVPPFAASSLLCTPQLPPFKVTLRNQLDVELNGVNKDHRVTSTPDVTMLLESQLLMGGFPEPETLGMLHTYGVRHIVNCCAGEQGLDASTTSHFSVYNLLARDEHDYLILHNHYDDFEQIIRSALDKNEGVFVHCVAGVNRSVVLCAAYMIDRFKISPVEAMRRFRHCGRMRILENVGFRHQLVDHFLQYTGSQPTHYTYTGSRRKQA